MFVFLFPFLVAWSPPVTPPSEPSEAEKTPYLCQATGEFNLAPNGRTLHFETWCVEEAAGDDGGVAVIKVEDTVIHPQKGVEGLPRAFQAPFARTVVTVETVDRKPVVKLSYRDQKNRLHTTTSLPARTGKAGENYRYDFSPLIQARRIAPFTRVRMMAP